jgi:hypothetical protein
VWFAVFPTYETITAQLFAAFLVVGSYYAARKFGGVPLAGADALKEAARVRVDARMVKPLPAVR